MPLGELLSSQNKHYLSLLLISLILLDENLSESFLLYKYQLMSIKITLLFL